MATDIPSSPKLVAQLTELRADLDPHLQREEEVLFPMIRALMRPKASTTASVQTPIAMLCAEHDRAGQLLQTLRTQTNGYVTPPDGCASYRAFYDGLAELEADLHLHVHKENNRLFPEAIELEARSIKTDDRTPSDGDHGRSGCTTHQWWRWSCLELAARRRSRCEPGSPRSRCRHRRTSQR